MAEALSDLLLSPKEQGAIRAKIPGTTNVIDFAREVSERTAKAQLAKVLNAPLEGGTDAISWGKGLQDGIKRERERIQVWGPEPCPHFDGYEKRECSLCWEDLFKGES